MEAIAHRTRAIYRARAEQYALLVVLPGLAALSCHYFAFGWVLAIALPLHLAAHTRGKLFLPPVFKQLMITGALWITWGLLSIAWAPDNKEAVHEIGWIVIGIAVAIVFTLASISESARESIRIGWMLAYLLAAGFAVWELLTGNHLVNDVAAIETNAYLVISLFGNPNNYAAFLLLCSPFLCWSFFFARGTKRAFALAVLISMPIFLVLSQGRIALVGLFAELFVLWLFHRRGRLGAQFFFVTLLVGGTILLTMFYEPMALKLMRIKTEIQTGGSSTVRWHLILNGLLFVRETLGIGVGAGGFEYNMMRPDLPFNTSTYSVFVINPHNFWLEILSQYGVVVFTAFVAWFLNCFRLAWRLRREALADGNKDLCTLSELAIVGMVGYVFASVENSSYIEVPMNWLFLGSLLGLLTNLSGSRYYRSSP